MPRGRVLGAARRQLHDPARGSASGSSAPTARARARSFGCWPGSTRRPRARSPIRGNVAPLIEMGARVQPRALGHRQHPPQRRDARLRRRARCRPRSTGSTSSPACREFADLPLKYYSSGMYMRLAFAIATEIDPDILLIDESLGVGDAAFIDKAKARIRGLARPLQRRRYRLARPESPPRALHSGHLDPAWPARRRRADRRQSSTTIWPRRRSKPPPPHEDRAASRVVAMQAGLASRADATIR